MSKLTKAHIQFLEKQLKDLDNGTIELRVHDGIITQLSKAKSSLFATEDPEEPDKVIHLT